MEEGEKRNKGRKKTRNKVSIDEEIPSAPVLSDFIDASDSTADTKVPEIICDNEPSVERTFVKEKTSEQTFVHNQFNDQPDASFEPAKHGSSSAEKSVVGQDTSSGPQNREEDLQLEEESIYDDRAHYDLTSEEPQLGYEQLKHDLRRMEPHFFLNKDLGNLRLEESGEQEENADHHLQVAVEPSCPGIEPNCPDNEPSCPVNEPSFPVIAPSCPGIEPTCPVNEPSFPVIKPSCPVNEPSFPVIEPSCPGIEPSFPVIEPTCPVNEPSFPVIKPSCPGIAPSAPQFKNEGNIAEDRQLNRNLAAMQHQVEQTKQQHSQVEAEEEAEFVVEMKPFTDSQLHTLYHNIELEKNNEFVNHWLDTQINIEKFELDELLTNYHRVRLNLLTTKKELEKISANIQQLQMGLWAVSKEEVEEEGECEDGNIVTAVKERTIAEFSPETLKSLRSQFKQGRDTLAENLALFNFRAELARLKVDDFIHLVLERSLNKEGGSGVFTPQEELRLTVSVLFKFLRKDIQDEKLVRDLRIWLDRTIGVVLTESTLYDHLFILNHIMRCPAGVGKWGACYVQPAIPYTDPEETTFDNPFLDHVITILATILLPVARRAEFIHEFKLRANNFKQMQDSGDSPEDSIWTVLDGEGSEDEDPSDSWSELREADLIALFNQIPVDHMFRYVLRIEEKDSKDWYDVSRSTQHSMLKLYAFSTQFVYLLREGLKTFNTPKYRQFAKRLGRLIRHTVHFVSDHWENFKAHNVEMIDSPMFQRLQLEYDCFFLRATKCIFSSLKLGIWQYLAEIPYGTISSDMLWRIFYVLHLDYHEESHSDFGSEITDWVSVLSSPDLQIQFEEKCAEADESELFFLLSAFTNMALSRDARESVFIRRVVMDLFYIGFASESTRDASCKNCRDLLASVCISHPFVLSYIIQVLKLKGKDIGKLSSYLVQELPWINFKPSHADLSVVFTWLKSHIGGVENLTARIILSNMNWEFGYLPVEQHISTSITVIEAFVKFTNDASHQGIVNSSVSTMSNLAMATISSAGSHEHQFTKWSWELLSRLRLHMMDRSEKEYKAVLSGEPEVYNQLLDFDLNQEIENIVSFAVSKQPMACYCVLLLTQVGHALPEILERGLGFVKVILDSGRFDHAIELMAYILPIFVTDASAIDHPDLVYVMTKLMCADQSYLSLAKTMIRGNFPGPVTKELGNMFHKIISHFSQQQGQFSLKDVFDLLISILMKLPNWNSNSSSLYLLDLICSYAFRDKTCHSSVLDIFEKYHSTNNQYIGAKGIFSIFNFSNQGHNLTIAVGATQFPWLSYFVLQSEDNYIQKSGLWRALVSELSTGKVLDDALQEASRITEVNAPTSSQLVLYRWAQQAIDSPVHCPILFVFWQRFFSLFLSRPSELIKGQEGACIGNSFFQGIINSMYFTKIKNSLKSSIDTLEKNLKTLEGLEHTFCEDICKLFRTYYIWTDDSKVMDSSLYIPALSPVYDPARLIKVVSGDTTLWMEFFNKEKVVQICQDGVADWDKLHFRHYSEHTSIIAEELKNDNPESRIIERLRSYDSRLPGPPVRRLSKPIPIFPRFTSCEALNHSLSGPLQSMNDFSDYHCHNISLYGSLNCSYQEIVSSLWREEEITLYVTAACPGMMEGKEKRACSGPALVPLTFYEFKIQEGISVKIETNRKEASEVENQLLSSISPKYVVAAAVVNNIIQSILKSFEKDLGKGITSIHLPLASYLFCYLAKATTENWLTVPPLRHFISECLENLATVVVSQGGCKAEIILDILKESPHLSSMLTPHFFPQPAELLAIYSKIGELPIGDGSLSFVLLSKLDIKDYLQSGLNKIQVSQLLEIIFRNLEITGIKPEDRRLMVHCLHRKHTCQVLSFNFQQYYLVILEKILNLCGCSQIDPEIVVDVLNAVIEKKNAVSFNTPEEDVNSIFQSYAENEQYDYPTVLSVISNLSAHFDRDRLNFGLYGLYPKYRDYLKPLSQLFSLLSLQMVYSELHKHGKSLPKESTDFLWRNLKSLFDPWLSPINPTSIPSTASWIQQLSDKGSSLMPWIPGDSGLAKMMIDSLTNSLQIIIEHESESNVLSNLLFLYSDYYASSGTKDHIFGVVHPALTSLDWSLFKPNLKDIDAMMKIIGMFLPQSHAFLGTTFVQIDWQLFVSQHCHEEDHLKRILPSLFCLLTKLSSEPSIRQGGRLLSIVTQAESWAWGFVDATHYESLAQWYVMSVDSRCIVKHKERNPLDAAILRLFIAVAEFGSDNQGRNSERKQLMWVKCCAKLLTSVCSKQKNFLSINQPALHTTIRKLLEEMQMSSNETTAGPMIKDYLSIFNATSSSVLPGSALVVTQSWFTQARPDTRLVPAFLSFAGHTVRDAKLASSILESTLETYFKDEDSKPTWAYVKQVIGWPSGVKMAELLDVCVVEGHCLVLYAYIHHRQGECINSQEEQALASSLLEYTRQLATISVPGLDCKLPLLYKKLVEMLTRLIIFNKDTAWPVNALAQFSDILVSIADFSPGWGRNILGAIGLGTQTAISLRGQFLARALATFIRSLLNVERTGLIEKQIEASEEGSIKELVLQSQDMKIQLEKLRAYKSNKGFSGFQDVLLWVLNQVELEVNLVADTPLFIDYLVRDKLYTEIYLRT